VDFFSESGKQKMANQGYSLQCSQSTNQSRSFSIYYRDIYEYSRAWTVRNDPLNAFGKTADTRLFCALRNYGAIYYNQTQDLCDETLGLGMVGQRPWAGCFVDPGLVPHINPGFAANGEHEDTWCWLWESSYTCDVIVDKLLNENQGNIRNGTKQDLLDSLGSIGCLPIKDSNNRTVTNCKFENPNGDYIHPSRPHVFDFKETGYPGTIRYDLVFQSVCNVKSASFNGIVGVDTQSDYRYKPLCCSMNNVTEVTDVLVPSIGTIPTTQIDPITGKPLTTLMCDETWCLDDPYGNCLNMYLQECTGTSSCNRHNYLSPFNPVIDGIDPSALVLLQTLSVSGYAPTAQPFGGLPCSAYYQRTKDLSVALPQFAGDAFSVTLLRISQIQEQVSSYCTDPSTRGNGECGCLRGYQSLGAGFTPSNSPAGLGQGADQTSVTYFSVPSTIKNFSHRIDLYCDPYGPAASSFTGVNSYSSVDGENSCTDNTPPSSCITFSNACSSFSQGVGVDQYPLFGGVLGKKYPSLNPNNSLLSATNYGDAISQRNKNPGYSALLGQGPASNPFSIPYRCWLPACVDLQIQDVIFNDLLQNTPCPDVCYAYGGSSAIDLTNVDANVISMGNFVNQCNYEGNSSTVNVDPFALPALLMNGFQFDIPQGYRGSLTFNVFNTEQDVASVASSKTVQIFSDIPSLVSITQDVTLLYKYSYTSIPSGTPNAHDSISVTLTVNGTSPTPAYYQMNMYLKDSNLGSMRIPITMNIFSTISDPTNESNWPRACAFYADSVTNNFEDAKCHAVDCFFGSNSYLTNAVKPPLCSAGQETFDTIYNSFFTVNTGFVFTAETTQDGVPVVARTSTQLFLPVRNYEGRSVTQVFNTSDIALFGLTQLLDTHVQLFGPLTSTTQWEINPRFNLVG
jgi:hypothetical protein